jgi:hypothetical protein
MILKRSGIKLRGGGEGEKGRRYCTVVSLHNKVSVSDTLIQIQLISNLSYLNFSEFCIM